MKNLIELNWEDLKSVALANCPACRGTQRTADQDECFCDERFLRRIEDANFPPRFGDTTLVDLDWSLIQPTEARNTLHKYIANLGVYLDEVLGLFLVGAVGCGKTHLAVGLGTLACALGYAPIFVNVPGWFQQLRESYEPSNRRNGSWSEPRRSANERDLIRDLIDAPVLILDDLGAERPSDWMRERLYLIVNERWITRRPTLVTTNESPAQLGNALGERTLSRLCGDAIVLALTGADYRSTHKAQRLRAL